LKVSAKRRVKPLEAAMVAAAVAVAGLSWARNYPSSFRVAAVQMHSRMGDLNYNRARMTELAREAAGKGAQVVVFPEAAVTGYVSEDFEIWTDPVARPGEGRSLQNYAEAVDGRSVQLFGELAAELGIYVVVPFIEYDRAQRKYFNTLVLVGPGGKLRAHYRKLNPWPRAEATWASDGDRGVVWVDTEFGRLGLLICYDIHSVADKLAAEKAGTLLYSIAWVDHKPQMWFDERLPDFARRLRVNIVGANWTFRPGRPLVDKGYGYTRIIDARGKVLSRAKAELGEEIVVADLPITSPPAD
jgi:predicted amidohydrolase